jgi:hypothetical protein
MKVKRPPGVALKNRRKRISSNTIRESMSALLKPKMPAIPVTGDQGAAVNKEIRGFVMPAC